jgi:tetraacyldisaccharide 4'-kinase
VRRESLARRALLAPLVPLSWIYAAGARLHRQLYRSGLLETRRFSGHVVGVGELVVGGAGRAPAAAWIASRLHARGRRVALASRGAGRRTREPCVVSDGRHVLGAVRSAGDEALILAAHAPGVPVLAGRDRARVGLRAFSAFGAEVLVLDDGFHQQRLGRDLDVLCIDASQGFGNRRVLPRGPLREPLAALRHADAVLVVDGPLAGEDEALLARWTPGVPRVNARRRAVGLRPLAGGAQARPELLEGTSVGLLAGIASPASLRRTLASLGARVVAERLFPAHHRYRPRDLTGLAGEASLWVTTEEDAVKVLPVWAAGADVRALSIELEVDEPEPFLDWIEAGLR